MSDRCDSFFRQRVTAAELDLAFELLEKADRSLAADIGIYGIISGAEPSEHQPVPDLTIDLVAPARAYDRVTDPGVKRRMADILLNGDRAYWQKQLRGPRENPVADLPTAAPKR